MATTVTFALTYGTDAATLTLVDTIGTNNSWSCNPQDFLSAAAGGWAQGIGSNPIALVDKALNLVLQFDAALNMFNPKVGQIGDAISAGDGGTVPDTQIVHWYITKVA